MDIFEANRDISKNAYMNWNMIKDDIPHNLKELANSYANSAELMMSMVIENNIDKKADALIFPIFYSINQSIEVYLKSIIAEIEELEGNILCNYTTHDILELFNNLKSKIKKKEKKTKKLEATLRPLKEYIDNLYHYINVKDEDGKNKLYIDFARYPINTDGKPHFYITEKTNMIVNVEMLSTEYKKIHFLLEGLYAMYEEERESKKCQD